MKVEEICAKPEWKCQNLGKKGQCKKVRFCEYQIGAQPVIDNIATSEESSYLNDGVCTIVKGGHYARST